MTIVSGLGSHRPQTEEEWAKLVGPEIYGTIRIEDSYEDDFVEVLSAAGEPLMKFTAPIARTDRRICIGNIDYHYFAGYSGGACRSHRSRRMQRKTIQANHSMMLDEKTKDRLS